MSKYCPICGKNNPDYANFCTACGTPLQTASETVHSNDTISRLLDTVELKKVKKNNKYGWQLKGSDELVIPCQWERADDFSDGRAAVCRDGLYGYIDKAGQLVIPYRWKYACYFDSGLAWVKNDDNKYGLINKNGDVILPFKWCDVRSKYMLGNGFSSKYGLEAVAVEIFGKKRWGFINKSGKEVVPYIWRGAKLFSDGLAKVANDEGLWGFINLNGEIVIPCQYKEVSDFSNGKAYVKIEEKMYKTYGTYIEQEIDKQGQPGLIRKGFIQT